MIVAAGGAAVGDLTHGIGVNIVPVPGLNFGTTMAGIFNIIGSGYSLVTLDGGTANCGSTGPNPRKGKKGS